MAKKLYGKMNPQQIQDPISQKFNLDIKFSQKQKTQYGEGEESTRTQSQIPKKKQTKEKTPLYEQMLRKKWNPKSNL